MLTQIIWCALCWVNCCKTQTCCNIYYCSLTFFYPLFVSQIFGIKGQQLQGSVIWLYQANEWSRFPQIWILSGGLGCKLQMNKILFSKLFLIILFKILLDNFPDDTLMWHATVPVFVYLNTRFPAHSRLFPTIFAAAHTLYVTVPNWLFVRNILRLVKINPSPTKIWPLAPDIFTIFDQTHWTLKTPQLQNQFILDSGDKISS